MGFSGGGAGVLTNHTHDTAITNDGGALAANGTMFGLSAGSVLFSDGSNIQELGVGSASDVLSVNGAANAPEWTTPAGGAATTFFSYNTTSQNFTNSTYFSAFPSGGNNVWGYTESEFVIPCNTDLTFTRYQVNIRLNNKGSDQITAFRDDGSNVAPITVTASTTGTFDSGVVSVNIASGSLICWVYHATASGNIDMYATLGTVTT